MLNLLVSQLQWEPGEGVIPLLSARDEAEALLKLGPCNAVLGLHQHPVHVPLLQLDIVEELPPHFKGKWVQWLKVSFLKKKEKKKRKKT